MSATTFLQIKGDPGIKKTSPTSWVWRDMAISWALAIGMVWLQLQQDTGTLLGTGIVLPPMQ